MLVCKKSLQNCHVFQNFMSYIMNTQFVLICSRKFMGLIYGNRVIYFDTKTDTAFSFQKVLVSFDNQSLQVYGFV